MKTFRQFKQEITQVFIKCVGRNPNMSEVQEISEVAESLAEVNPAAIVDEVRVVTEPGPGGKVEVITRTPNPDEISTAE